MWHKAFQLVIVTYVVILTVAGAVLLISAGMSLLLPTNYVFAFAGGVSLRTLRLIAVMLMFLTVAVVYLIARRSKLR
jgi:hypothetical protein